MALSRPSATHRQLDQPPLARSRALALAAQMAAAAAVLEVSRLEAVVMSTPICPGLRWF